MTARLALATTVLPFLLTATSQAQCDVVLDITPGNAASNNTGELLPAFGRQLYFSQVTANEGNELWRWDPQTGAQLVVDLAPGTATSNPWEMTACTTAFGPRVFYRGFEIGHGSELYVTDGTPGGTGRLVEIAAGSSHGSPTGFTVVGSRVFFKADDGVHGEELWVSDGSIAGTHLVLDIRPGSADGRPQEMIEYRGKLLFTAEDGTHGRELWISDGTAGGTELVRDIRAGTSSSTPSYLTRLYVSPDEDHVFFSAHDGVAGRELWRTDGTTAGTTLAIDIFPGSQSGAPTQLCVAERTDFCFTCERLLFFRARPAFASDQVYVTDGTQAGTIATGIDGNYLTPAIGRVFFTSDQSGTGTELYSVDSQGVVQLVHDITPGSGSSYPEHLTDAGNGLFFVAESSGPRGVWFTDGTSAGTFEVCLPDPTGTYSPYGLKACNGHLFFMAYDAVYGLEPRWIETPGGSTTELGIGTAPDYPRLYERHFSPSPGPVPGGSVDIMGQGPNNNVTVLLAGDARLPLPVPVVPGLVEGGSDWTGALLDQAVVVTTGIGWIHAWILQIPNNPALEGTIFNFQEVWLDGGTPTLRLSNGMQLAIGSVAPH